MFARKFVALIACLSLATASGCDKASPTAPVSPPVLQGISVTPAGSGLEHATPFTFTASVSGSSGQTTFVWDFGDGTTSSRAATAQHTYTRAGTFVVYVTAANAAGQASASTTVRVASMVGRWLGVVSGHSTAPPNRPIPIVQFELRIDEPLLAGPPLRAFRGSWTDSAGCRETRSGFLRGEARAARGVYVGVEQLLCSDGDFYLSGTADADVREITGTCPHGGPACQFRMVRQ
jgi:hypothetical protein